MSGYPVPEAITREGLDEPFKIIDNPKNETDLRKGKMEVDLSGPCIYCGNNHGRAERIQQVGRVAFTPTEWKRKVSRKKGSAPRELVDAAEDARINTIRANEGLELTPMRYCPTKREHSLMVYEVFGNSSTINSEKFFKIVKELVASHNSDDFDEFDKAVEEVAAFYRATALPMMVVNADFIEKIHESVKDAIAKHFAKSELTFADSVNLANNLMTINNELVEYAESVQALAKKKTDEEKKKQQEALKLTMDSIEADVFADAMGKIEIEAITKKEIEDAIRKARNLQRQADKAEEKADKLGAVDVQAIIEAEKAREEAMRAKDKADKAKADPEKFKENLLKKAEDAAKKEAEEKAKQYEKEVLAKLAEEAKKKAEEIKEKKPSPDKEKINRIEVEQDELRRLAELSKKPHNSFMEGEDEWGDMNIVELPLTKRANAGYDRKLTVRDEGPIPTRFDRWAIDKRVFTRKRRTKGAVVLVDISGSMSWTENHLASVLKLFPAATVALYSGEWRSGNLLIVAKNGRRIGDVRIRDFAAGYGNIIDGMALKWLSKQDAEVKIWMSDGGITGVHEKKISVNTRKKLSKLLQSKGIMQVQNATEVMDVLSGKMRFQPTREIKVPYWY